VDVDRGQLVWRRLKDVVVVEHLYELAPVGRRDVGVTPNGTQKEAPPTVADLATLAELEGAA